MELTTSLNNLIDRFEQVVHDDPDRLAVAGSDGEVTFAQLDSHARALVSGLARHGIGRCDTVGICLPRGVQLLAALLAIWRAGAAYVPLDAAYPQDRLGFMASEAGMEVMLADGDPEIRIPGVKALCAAELMQQGDDPAPPSEATATSPLDLAYTIFTSGSTGRPKGVMVPRGAVTSLVAALEAYGAYANSPRVVAWNASATFDASVQQWVRVCRGDSIVVLDNEVRRDPAHLSALLDQYAVTDLDLTPSHWELVRSELLPPRADGRVLRLFIGGESIPEHMWAELAEAGKLKTLEALNLYGPTECTVDVTATWIRGKYGHIGRALQPNRCMVLDAGLRPVVPGAEGELYIAGRQVAYGYANRAALTAERFVADPFAGAGSRMYRTGDVVKLTESGDLEYRGRTDRQVKLRGFRIDLDEIEVVLNAHPGVARAIVLIREAGAAGKQLTAYFVPSRDAASCAELRRHAAHSLPDFMVPTVIQVLERTPLTPSGKLDVAALPDPDGSALIGPGSDNHESAIHTLIADVWAGVLGRNRLGSEANFFALGGHSLMALHVVARLKKELGFSIALSDIYKHPHLADLAAFVQSKADEAFGTTGTEH
jgi:amino acid adenylation domain-containing protein